MVSLQIRISSFKFIGNLCNCNVQFKRHRRGNKCKAPDMLTSVLDLHHRSRLLIHTISMNIKSGVTTSGLPINWFQHFLMKTSRSHVFVFNLIRSVFNTRYPGKHSFLRHGCRQWDWSQNLKKIYIIVIVIVSQHEDIQLNSDGKI